MADAAANLPCDQRILVRRIVANYQHSFGLIELFHGEEGIGGAIAESSDEARVVGGAVMIDVVGSERRAGQTLKQVIFFIGSAI